MSLFSFFRKNKQEAGAEESAFQSRAESDSQTVRPRKRKSTARATDREGNAPVDPVLPEKKRARRRLVGAVALVLAVVIGLPMVLDSEPKLLADDINIDIPSKDKPAAMRLTPEGAARAVGTGVASGSSSTAGDAGGGGSLAGMRGSRVPAASALDQKEEVIDPTPAVASALAASVKADPARATPLKPQVKTQDKTRDQAHDQTHDKAPDKGSEKAHDITPAHPADKPGERAADKSAVKPADAAAKAESADARHGKFTVQVAAFASMEKVNELRGKLKDAGIATYTQKIATEGGERIRIRVGPLNSRQDADRMRARLNDLGLNGTLVPAPS